MTNTDDGSRAHSAHGSGDVRANTPETFANLTHLPHLPHLPKSSSGYELHPTSSTSTRTTATVDGNRPIEDTRPLRSVEAIRTDLEHPHTAALTALHSTTIGDGPIGRLLRDVGPLVGVLEAVEAVIEEARKVSPSGSMVCYVADLERALGRDAARPHKIGVSDPGLPV